jgi:hypothetical protein
MNHEDVKAAILAAKNRLATSASENIATVIVGAAIVILIAVTVVMWW